MNRVFHDPEDVQVFSYGDTKGLIARIGGIEPHAVRAAAQPLNRVFPVYRDNNDASVDGLCRSIHDQEVAVVNPGVFHRVTLDTHQEGRRLIFDQERCQIERGFQIVLSGTWKASRHAPVNREGTTRQQRELEAESVSYAVLAHFGMHSESRFYLATYDVTAEMLTASLQTIGNAAKQIINLIAEAAGAAIEEGEGDNAPALAA